MELTKQTIDVLKHFSQINSNLLITEGNNLKTVAINKTIYASADVDTEFPQEFGIYNLGEFLNVLALFKNPVLNFTAKEVVVSERDNPKTKVKYREASKDILSFPDKPAREPKYDVEFNLSEDILAQVLKASGVIGAPDIQFTGDDNGISVILLDKKNPTNTFNMQITDSAVAAPFKFNFKVDNIKLIPGAYKVSISSKGLGKFSSDAVTVLVSMESDSSYGE